jgi:hypothetical protein
MVFGLQGWLRVCPKVERQFDISIRVFVRISAEYPSFATILRGIVFLPPVAMIRRHES